MKKVSMFLFGFSFVLLVISFVGIYFSSKAIQRESFYVDVNVSDHVGFDVNTTALTFGSVVRGIGSSRSIRFENSYEFPVIVKTKVNGDIQELLYYDKEIYVERGETKKLNFGVNSGRDDRDGYYNGTIEIIVLRKT